MPIPELELRVDYVRLRGRLAERNMPKAVFAQIARLSYWYFCDVLAERITPRDTERLKLVRAADMLGWHDILVLPDGQSYSRPTPARSSEASAR